MTQRPQAEPAYGPTPGEEGPGGGDAPLLRSYLATLRREWRVVALLVVVCLAAALVMKTRSAPSYEATARVLLGQQQPVEAFLGTSTTSSDPERDLNTSVQLIGLDSVAAQVRDRLRLDLSVPQLLDRVTTAPDANSSIVSITARDRNRKRAADIANAFAVAYRDFRARSARDNVEAALVAAQRRLQELGPNAGQTSLGQRLARDIDRLQTVAAFQTGGVQIVRLASVPTSPAGMGTKATAALALLLGLILAGITIVVRTRTDRRLHDDGDVLRALDLGVVARLPARAGSGRSARSADPQRAEALATLATRLVVSSRSWRARVVLLVSPDAGTGTVDLAVGLAQTFAEMDYRAIAIEADLRAPRLRPQLEGDRVGGLAAVLERRAALQEELVPLFGVSSARQNGDQHPGQRRNAWALPAGKTVERPQPLLGGEEMATLIAHSRALADVVLIAGPALGPVGDSLALAPLVDGALLVLRSSHTTDGDAERALRALEEVECPVLGAVLTDAPRGAGSLGLTRRGAPRSGIRGMYPGPSAPADPAGERAVARERIRRAPGAVAKRSSEQSAARP